MHDAKMPESLKLYPSTDMALAAKPQATLLITDRLIETYEEELLKNGVIYRPKSLVLGMGCNRGTSAEEIEALIDETLLELKLSKKSVKAIATIDLKKDEECFLQVVAKNNWHLVTYTPAELNEMPLKNPSEKVFKYTGAYGVCEPAALRYANTNDWLLEKKKGDNATISVARISFDEEVPQ